MKSIYATTDEIDLDCAVRELLGKIEAQAPLLKNTVGILFYDYEMEGAELCGRLQAALHVDILGCSTIGTLSNESGYLDMAAALTLLTADDCEFHADITQGLTDQNFVNSIYGSYRNAKDKATRKPALIYCLLPCRTEIIFDHYLDELSNMADDLPMIGGVPTNHGKPGKSMAFNGRYCANSAITLLISGNVKPVFSMANVVETLSGPKGTITRAEGTTIYEVDGKPFAAYVKSYGMDIREFNKKESRAFFQQYPLLIETGEGKAETGLPYVRIIESIDWKDGSGIAFASVPEGAKVTLANLHKATIAETVKKGLDELFAKIAKSGAEYSVILCITCAARHFILNPYYDIEGKLIREMVPGQYQLSGFYSFGELCPISVEDGKARNRLHNGSIVFCAL